MNENSSETPEKGDFSFSFQTFSVTHPKAYFNYLQEQLLAFSVESGFISIV